MLIVCVVVLAIWCLRFYAFFELLRDAMCCYCVVVIVCGVLLCVVVSCLLCLFCSVWLFLMCLVLVFVVRAFCVVRVV